jgi:hypothetical protein
MEWCRVPVQPATAFKEVKDKTFVFFFERGNTGLSWRIRDYSGEKPPPKEYIRRTENPRSAKPITVESTWTAA